MPLHPQAAAFLASMREAGAPPLYELPPSVAREGAKQMLQLIGEGPQIAVVADHRIPVDGGSILGREYRPNDGASALIVYFHGGGWVLGDVSSSDPMCRCLAAASGATVLSVDYRLAPEFPYPTAADDAFAAIRWAAEGLPHDLGLIVAGDSAGGNLAAVSALRARDEGGPALDLQVLVYPVTDHDFARASYTEHGDSGLLLGLREMAWFWDLYAPVERRNEAIASPLRADSLAGLPPALVLIDEYDPLRDEGLAYAARLESEGVAVELLRFDDMLHGFFSMVNLFSRADEAVEEVGGRIRDRLSATGP